MQHYILTLQQAYYEGNPQVSNEEYDALVARFGEDGLGIGGDFKHRFRMFSLDKVYPGRGDEYPLDLALCVETPKLDGCAISLLYVDEDLIQGNTRGDGISSPTTFEDWKLRALGIPDYIQDAATLQITGEVVTTKRVENERNFASGAMQLQDEDEFASRVKEGGMIFVAYNMQESDHYMGVESNYEMDMEWLAEQEFHVVTASGWEQCPQDGIVYRLNDNEAFWAAGFTHKHPKGAFAVKEDEQAVTTTLLEVVWATGKTGKVTPTAIFEEIVIDDAKISRATLNNAGYIEAMGLEIGDQIQVIRSGGIIPKIIGKL